MFKHDFLEWCLAAGIRAIKTLAQTMAAVLSLGAPGIGILDISWWNVFQIAALAAVLSLLTSIAGLPEIKLKNGVKQTCWSPDER